MQNFDTIISRLRSEQNLPKQSQAANEDASQDARQDSNGFRVLKASHEHSDISYTRTRCVDVDQKVLTRNRVIAHNKLDPMSSPYHILRAKVLQAMRKNNWTTLGITAPSPDAGKSLTACNLAVSIAMQTSQTVLLVDMDLRKPTVARYFGLKPEFGIHDYLEGNASIQDTLIHPNMERLVILPGRKPILNSSEELSSEAVANLVQELKTRYDARYVIFDLPPVLISDDVLVFLPYLDCSLLVIEDGGNTREEIEDAIEFIGSNPLLGTVLNKCEKTRNTYGYGYYEGQPDARIS